ncbi:hypothetical protein [uncultured Ferrimonas sp.]|uniref:hypothetical protein n=1 Tax=uncultured Ferrimonas sp. TaxID=432640 RepID=UPI00262F4622|nr:hypothetical protein [uncultured Ferrimonas sp.]
MSHDNSVLLRFSNRTGLFGLFLLTVTPVLAALMYCGDANERFSFLNHTLSELGRYDVSQWALLVNGGLFFGGLSLVASFATRLWLVRGVEFQAALYSAGIVLALAITAVGLFPVNVGSLHQHAMTTFYLMTPICALLYCVALWRDRSSRLGIAPATMAALLAISAFLDEHRDLMLMDRYGYGLFGEQRPTIWWPALEGWLLLASVGLWLFFTLGVIRRQQR